MDYLLELVAEEDDMPTPSQIAAAVWSAESGRGENRITFGGLLWEIRSLARAAAEGQITQEDLDALRAATREGVLSAVDELAGVLAERLGQPRELIAEALTAAAEHVRGGAP